MDADIAQLLIHINKLSEKDKRYLILNIKSDATIPLQQGASIITELRREIFKEEDLKCPHCQSKNFIGFGNYKERKRYRCKECQRTFNEHTGTAVAYIHNMDKWVSYICEMQTSPTLRVLSKKIGICLDTSFNWRHKILKSLKIQGYKKLRGITEADETFFRYSEKGNKKIIGRKTHKRGGKASKAGINKEQVAVITALDRKNHSVVEVACRGRITSAKINEKIGVWLDPKDLVLCTDSHRSYESFSKKSEIVQKKVNVSKKQYVRDKMYHVQTVNSFHSNLKNWIRKFCGVASKYLQDYMDYFRILKLSGLKKGWETFLYFSLVSSSSFLKTKMIKQQLFRT